MRFFHEAAKVGAGYALYRRRRTVARYLRIWWRVATRSRAGQWITDEIAEHRDLLLPALRMSAIVLFVGMVAGVLTSSAAGLMEPGTRRAVVDWIGGAVAMTALICSGVLILVQMVKAEIFVTVIVFCGLALQRGVETAKGLLPDIIRGANGRVDGIPLFVREAVSEAQRALRLCATIGYWTFVFWIGTKMLGVNKNPEGVLTCLAIGTGMVFYVWARRPNTDRFYRLSFAALVIALVAMPIKANWESITNAFNVVAPEAQAAMVKRSAEADQRTLAEERAAAVKIRIARDSNPERIKWARGVLGTTYNQKLDRALEIVDGVGKPGTRAEYDKLYREVLDFAMVKVSPPSVPPQCSDGADNDGDGRIDFDSAETNPLKKEYGCSSAADNSESAGDPTCANGKDDDDNGLADDKDPHCLVQMVDCVRKKGEKELPEGCVPFVDTVNGKEKRVVGRYAPRKKEEPPPKPTVVAPPPPPASPQPTQTRAPARDFDAEDAAAALGVLRGG